MSEKKKTVDEIVVELKQIYTLIDEIWDSAESLYDLDEKTKRLFFDLWFQFLSTIEQINKTDRSKTDVPNPKAFGSSGKRTKTKNNTTKANNSRFAKVVERNKTFLKEIEKKKQIESLKEENIQLKAPLEQLQQELEKTKQELVETKQENKLILEASTKKDRKIVEMAEADAERVNTLIKAQRAKRQSDLSPVTQAAVSQIIKWLQNESNVKKLEKFVRSPEGSKWVNRVRQASNNGYRLYTLFKLAPFEILKLLGYYVLNYKIEFDFTTKDIAAREFKDRPEMTRPRLEAPPTQTDRKQLKEIKEEKKRPNELTRLAESQRVETRTQRVQDTKLTEAAKKTQKATSDLVEEIKKIQSPIEQPIPSTDELLRNLEQQTGLRTAQGQEVIFTDPEMKFGTRPLQMATSGGDVIFNVPPTREEKQSPEYDEEKGLIPLDPPPDRPPEQSQLKKLADIMKKYPKGSQTAAAILAMIAKGYTATQIQKAIEQKTVEQKDTKDQSLPPEMQQAVNIAIPETKSQLPLSDDPELAKKEILVNEVGKINFRTREFETRDLQDTLLMRKPDSLKAQLDPRVIQEKQERLTKEHMIPERTTVENVHVPGQLVDDDIDDDIYPDEENPLMQSNIEWQKDIYSGAYEDSIDGVLRSEIHNLQGKDYQAIDSDLPTYKHAKTTESVTWDPMELFPYDDMSRLAPADVLDNLESYLQQDEYTDLKEIGDEPYDEEGFPRISQIQIYQPWKDVSEHTRTDIDDMPMSEIIPRRGYEKWAEFDAMNLNNDIYVSSINAF